MEFTLAELRALPTIRSGPVADLKLDTGRYRVWVRREDGNRAPIAFHARVRDRWEAIGWYRERLPAACRNLLHDTASSDAVGSAAES